MCRESWKAHGGREKVPGSPSKRQPSTHHRSPRQLGPGGLGPSVQIPVRRTVERNHCQEVITVPGVEVGTDAPPNGPQIAHGKETLWRGSGAARKEEMRDAERWERMEHSMRWESTRHVDRWRGGSCRTKTNHTGHRTSPGLTVSTFSSAALRHFRFWSISLICSSISRQRLLVTVTGVAQARLRGGRKVKREHSKKTSSGMEKKIFSQNGKKTPLWS